MSRIKERIITTIDLCAAAREIRYETDIFHFSYHATRPPAPPPHDGIFLECFLLHWRTLWYFFLEEPKKEDVVATDYIASWSPKRPLVDSTKRVHTMLAHISKLRLGAKAFTAEEILMMYEQIAELWTQFYGQLPSQSERDWFGQNPLKHKFPVKYRAAESPLLKDKEPPTEHPTTF